MEGVCTFCELSSYVEHKNTFLNAKRTNYDGLANAINVIEEEITNKSKSTRKSINNTVNSSNPQQPLAYLNC